MRLDLPAATAALLPLLLFAQPCGAAGADLRPLVRTEHFSLSARAFQTYRGILAARTSDAAELERKARAWVDAGRDRLLLAEAAVRAGLERDPEVVKALEALHRERLLGFVMERDVYAPARERGQAGGPRGASPEEKRLRAEAVREAQGIVRGEVDAAGVARAAAGGDDDPVVARIDGREIRFSAVRASVGSLRHPSSREETEASLIELLVGDFLASESLYAAAKRTGADRDPVFLDDLQEGRSRVLSRFYVQRSVHASLPEPTPGEVEERYRAQGESLRRGRERELYEILVRDERTAREIRGRLERGGAFEEEVRKHSVGPTKERGGFIGWRAEGELLPALDRAASALAAGEISPVVRTDHGFHLLRCARVAEGRLPPLEEVAEVLRNAIVEERKREAVTRTMKELGKTIDVTIDEALLAELAGAR